MNDATESAGPVHTLPVVCAYNEWDPLEEVVVGVVEGATVPPWDEVTRATMPDHASWFFKEHGGKPFPEEMIAKAVAELDGLAQTLQGFGVTVRRPERMDFSKTYRTPWWESTGLYAAMPRDVFMVIGETIVEAPMAWRTRYFEGHAYHPMIVDYFKKGARWLSAPRSSMDAHFYDASYDPSHPYVDGTKRSPISESEIAFDAADFVRLGTDILVQKSHVTNALGIEWVRRHVAPEFNVHEVEFGDPHPMHIDTTIVPLAPGKILINPEWVKELPPFFSGWEVLVAPPPAKPFDSALYFSSDWLSINTFSIDEKHVVVEADEYPLIEALKGWGFEPVPVPFRNFYPFGGSVHCATLDIRRRGELRSYLA